ncbi:MAG: C25 family cysteine peptidase [Chloroflexota bacterium]
MPVNQSPINESHVGLRQEISPTGIEILHVDSRRMIIQLSTPTFTNLDGVDELIPCQRVEVAGYPLRGVTGTPHLPVQVAMLGIPAHGQVSWSIDKKESQTIAVTNPICPAPQAVAKGWIDENHWAGVPDSLYNSGTAQFPQGDVVRYIEEPALPDPAIYTEDRLFPQEVAQIQTLGFMRSQNLAQLEIYPFQYNPVDGELVYHQHLQVTIDFGEDALDVHGTAPMESSNFEEAMATHLLNYEVARNWREQPVHAVSSPWLPPADSYRIETSTPGIHMVTYDELAAAGFPVDVGVPADFRLYYEGEEIAIRVIGGNDGSFNRVDFLLFYAEDIDERFTGSGFYWLTCGCSETSSTAGSTTTPQAENSPPKRMDVRSGSVRTDSSMVTTYQERLILEENLNYISSLPMESGYDHWYGPRLIASGTGNSAESGFAFQLNEPISEQLTEMELMAQLQIAVASNLRGQHHLKVLVNEEEVSEYTWDAQGYHIFTAEFEQLLLNPGKNSITLQLINDTPGQVIDILFVDWVQLDYFRELTAQSNHLAFDSTAPGRWTYQLSGFSTTAGDVNTESRDVELYDITDLHNVTFMQYTSSSNTIQFSDDQTTVRRYLAISPSEWQSPAAITQSNTANLLSSADGADYIVIAHPDFLQAIKPLVDYRTKQDLRTQLVNVQDIYDSFNYGKPSPEAIQQFLAYAYANWPAPAPAYVLLVGDGNYDPRGYLSTSEPNFILPYLEVVDKDLGETATDNRFVTVAGEDILPDMHVGRFAAKSAAHVAAMVEKTIAYERGTITDGWNERVLFVTDDLQGGGGAFYNYSDAIADGHANEVHGANTPLLPESYERLKYYLGYQQCSIESTSTCRQDIVDEMNLGSLFVSYVGHGAKQYWAEERLLTLNSVEQLQNADRLPIMLPMTCLEGFFHEAQADSDSFGESIVRMSDIGAVASWSPTGFGLASGHDYLERGLFLAVFHQDIYQLGAATTFGKMYLVANAPPGKYEDLIDTFVLFGDPALGIRVANSQPVNTTQELFLPIIR